MKTSALVLLSLAMIPAAHADYNLSAKSGAIHCSDDDGSTVTINAARTVITFHWSGDEAGPGKYRVTSTNTDGDTYFAYVGGDKRSGVRLELDDQGDKLVSNEDSSESTELHCE